MIFQQAKQILAGTKTRFMQLRKPGDIVGFDTSLYLTDPPIIEIYECPAGGKHRTIRRVGNLIRVQAGYGKPTLGQIRITKIGLCSDVAIHTSDDDGRAEGFEHGFALWLYWLKKYKDRAHDPVWVIHFQPVKERPWPGSTS